MTAVAAERARHEPERHRFAIALDDGVAVLEYRPVDATTLDYHHTFVPPGSRGRGLASELHSLLATVRCRASDLKIVPTCPFVAAFIHDHPEFRSVLAS